MSGAGIKLTQPEIPFKILFLFAAEHPEQALSRVQLAAARLHYYNKVCLSRS